MMMVALPVPPCALFFFFQAEDGIRDLTVTGVQTCALPISHGPVDGGAYGGGHGVHRQRSTLWSPPLLLHWSLPSARRRRDAHLRVGRLAAWARSLGLDRPRRGGGELVSRPPGGMGFGGVRS